MINCKLILSPSKTFLSCRNFVLFLAQSTTTVSSGRGISSPLSNLTLSVSMEAILPFLMMLFTFFSFSTSKI